MTVDKQGIAEGIRMAHDVAIDLMDELIERHNAVKPTFFGRPRKAHHRLLGSSRALSEFSDRITAMHKEVLFGAGEPT